MSTARKNAKQAKPTPASQAAPVAQPVVAPVAVLDAEKVAADPVKTRIQTSKMLGIYISPARVRRHLGGLNLNAGVDEMINKLRADELAYKTAQDKVKTGATKAERTDAENFLKSHPSNISEQISAYMHERIRFSNETPVVLAIICDVLNRQLIELAISNATEKEQHIIRPAHLLPKVSELTMWPLVRSLPSFAKLVNETAEGVRVALEAALIKAAVLQAEKDFKKKYDVKGRPAPAPKQPVVATTPVQAAPVQVASEPVKSGPESKVSFRSYVYQLCRELIKSSDEEPVLRISTGLVEVMTDVNKELIARLAPLIFLAASSIKNKTVDGNCVLRVVKSMMIDGHSGVETFALSKELIIDPAVLKAETEKRDTEKAAGREYKVNKASLEKVETLVATRHVAYPASGYDQVKEIVDEKLKIYATLGKSAKTA